MANNHPINDIADVLEQQGIVVLDDVRRMPVYNEPYISPCLVVVLNIQGWVKMEYDMQPVLFNRHEIAVVHPNHTLCAFESSDDYRAIMVVMAPSRIEEMKGKMPAIFLQMHRYVRNPDFALNDDQFADVYDQMRLMRNVSRSGGPNRELILKGMLHVLLLMLQDYKEMANLVAPLTQREELFVRFYEAILANYHQSREVSYYADMLCMSPKHFAAVIKQLTGITAHDWICNYVALQAKRLLDRPGMTVQQVSEQLGFVDQAAFSRFYKTRTGRSPSECRRG